jgi:tetratricopeptide (TPR) repeat protein
MGYSNPASYDPVLEFLHRHTFWDSRDKVVARLSEHPALLAKEMPEEQAHRLRDALEALGGIVELRRRRMMGRGVVKKLDRETVLEDVGPVPTQAAGGSGKLFLAFFVVALGVAVYLFVFRETGTRPDGMEKAVRTITSPFRLGGGKKKVAASKMGAPDAVAPGNNKEGAGVRLNNEGVALFNKGLVEEAIRSFEEALKKLPGESAVLQNLHRAWVQRGHRQLDDKQYEQAILSFEEAVKIFDESPEVYKVMGIAILNLADESAAEQYFRIYLERVPNDPDVNRILGELLYKQNRLREAMEYLKVYLAANPGDVRIRGILEKVGREAAVEQDFETRSGKHFDVRYEGAENMGTGYFVVELLEDAFQRIGAQLNYYPPEHISTILYSDEDFRDVTQSPDWALGVYDGKIRVPIGGLQEKTAALEEVVLHEYTHAMIHQQTGGKCPAWLNEGLAQYFAEESDARHVQNVRALLQGGSVPPLRQLEASFLDLNARAASRAYSVSYTVVDYIIEEHGIYAVQRLLSEVSTDGDVEAALVTALGMDYGGIQEEWLAYLARKYR